MVVTVRYRFAIFVPVACIVAIASGVIGYCTYRKATLYTEKKLIYVENASKELVDYLHKTRSVYYTSRRTKVFEENDWDYDLEAYDYLKDFIARYPNSTSALIAKLEIGFLLIGSSVFRIVNIAL